MTKGLNFSVTEFAGFLCYLRENLDNEKPKVSFLNHLGKKKKRKRHINLVNFFPEQYSPYNIDHRKSY